MDPLLLGGLLLALVAIALSMVLDGNSLGALLSLSALLLVVGGSLGASLMTSQLADVKRLPGALRVALRGKARHGEEHLTTLASCADVARREGVLALERRLGDIDDDFLRQGLQLVVDGNDAEQVRERLDIDVAALEQRHHSVQRFFHYLAGVAPTVGMIGTVIGLVNMLGNLQDPEQLGTGMALALLTTLYGVVLANLLILPLATKLERLHELEVRARELVCEGVVAVQSGASPRVLVERLEGHLPPAERLGYEARMAAAHEEGGHAGTGMAA